VRVSEMKKEKIIQASGKKVRTQRRGKEYGSEKAVQGGGKVEIDKNKVSGAKMI